MTLAAAASASDTTVIDVLGDEDTIRCEFSGDQLTVSAPQTAGVVLGWGLGVFGLGPGSGATVTVGSPPARSCTPPPATARCRPKAAWASACGVPEVGPGPLTSDDRGLGMILPCRYGCST
jgi:hypothetical protein